MSSIGGMKGKIFKVLAKAKAGAVAGKTDLQWPLMAAKAALAKGSGAAKVTASGGKVAGGGPTSLGMGFKSKKISKTGNPIRQVNGRLKI